MKFTTTTFAALVAILPMANAWIFTTCTGQWDADEKNKGCTKSACKAGAKIDWEADWGSDCVLRIYSDGSCGNQIGIASDDWNDHKLGKSMGSFRVSGCDE